MDNQHREIVGYRDLEQWEIDLMNTIKRESVDVGNLIVDLEFTTHVDQRWVAIAKTHLQQGFMALTRAVARPESF